MAVILVRHDRQEPALYGAMAAVIAHARGAEIMHLPVQFEGAEAMQHVTADGMLVPSGLVWAERVAAVSISGATTPAAIFARARERDVVVPIVGRLIQATQLEALRAAADAGIAVEQISVEGTSDCFRFVEVEVRASVEDRSFVRDGFGRFAPRRREVELQSGRRLRVGVVGHETDHREGNPATLAALGDAAEAASLALDVVFIAPDEVDEEGASGLVACLDGVVLPGGANMANVPAQILIARATLTNGTPTVGLCLGMQTMTTAVMQRRLGLHDANLAEVDPHAEVKVFVPLVGHVPNRHRLGEHTIETLPGSRLRALLGTHDRIRSNHRYKLNPDLVGPLQRAGLAVTARDDSGAIVEAVELARHPFYAGMQGHPELKSRCGNPHPLLKSFLEAAASRRS